MTCNENNDPNFEAMADQQQVEEHFSAAELLNGRLAMVGFVLVLALEAAYNTPVVPLVRSFVESLVIHGQGANVVLF